MALKVKAVERLQKIGTYAGTYRYVLAPDLYTSLSQDKVIKEAALRSGVSKGVMQACWDAAGEVIKACLRLPYVYVRRAIFFHFRHCFIIYSFERNQSLSTMNLKCFPSPSNTSPQ